MPNQSFPPEPDPVTVPMSSTPPQLSGGPGDDWQSGLYKRVLNAIYALPSYFKSSLDIKGIRATDLYTLNTPLGAAIEQSVVDNLNAIRSVWDFDGSFQSYSFVRQSQAFPDVRLQTDSPSIAPRILLGIELKGWFALAKEGEPSFRYLVTPNACAPADLLVVFPWILDEIVSGSPRLLKPFVTEAKFAAEHRNNYWRFSRQATGSSAAIVTASFDSPYPARADQANDAALLDPGKNFGRVARSGIMSSFIAEMMDQPLAGIPMGAWQKFIRIFADGSSKEKLQSKVLQLANLYASLPAGPNQTTEAFMSVVDSLEALAAEMSA